MLTENNVETKEVDIMNDVSTKKENAVENKTVEFPQQEIDGVIDLTTTRKKRFYINRDTGNDGILYLDTSDFSIINRLNDLYPKLQELAQRASREKLNEQESTDESELAQTSKILKELDDDMRDMLDKIFDSNVSEICAPTGTMFDPFNGQFRFEHITEKLIQQYTSNINAEYKKMYAKIKKRISKSKYVSGN